MTEAAAIESISPEALRELINDEAEFTSYFKKRAVTEKMGFGFWKPDGKRSHRLVLPDGSYVRLKFFDTIKEIFNSKNVPVPGRESFFSYLEVSVMPIGIKGYSFNVDVAQHVMAPVRGKPTAKSLHAESISKLVEKATALGIDLSQPGSWETYYVRF